MKLRSIITLQPVTSVCSTFDLTHDIVVGVLAWILGLYHVQLATAPRPRVTKGVQVFRPQQMVIHPMKVVKQEGCVDALQSWPPHMRFDQQLVIGCGDVGRSGPLHMPENQTDMYDAHAFYQRHGEPVELGSAGVHGYMWARVRLDGTVNHRGVRRVAEVLEWSSTHTHPVGNNNHNPAAEGEEKEGEREWRVLPAINRLFGYENTQHSVRRDVKLSELGQLWVPFSRADCDPPGGISGKK